MPERIRLDDLLAPTGKARERLLDVARNIADGAVCIYPTDTIYGIGGRYDEKAVFERILAAKERSPEQQMILIAGSFNSFTKLDVTFGKAASRCAERFWPGLLTMVLPSVYFPEGIGIRVSDHPFLTALNSVFTVPLFSTSANKTGVPYDPDPERMYAALGQKVDFMIDAGVLPPSKPSTVIRISSHDGVKVLREGCIPADEIYRVIEA